MFNVEIQGAIIKPIYWNLTSPVCLSAYTYSIFIKKWDIFEWMAYVSIFKEEEYQRKTKDF